MNKYIDNEEIKISKEFINKSFDLNKANENEVLFSNRQILFEQYKLLIDSSHKTEERRNASNSVFLGINTLLYSFLVKPSQLLEDKVIDIFVLILSLLIGIFISWNWLQVIESYKKLNHINFMLIKSFEKQLPTCLFSLRADLESQNISQKNSIKGNVILTKENFLPKVFIFLYLIYCIIAFCYIIK